MEKLLIEPTNITPQVAFDPNGQLEISGLSLPEDSYEFYNPMLAWVTTYAKSPAAKTELIFKFEYFNTSSTSYILKLIKEMAKLLNEGHQATVSWYHDYDDDDMSEAGKGLGSLTTIPVNLIGYKAKNIY